MENSRSPHSRHHVIADLTAAIASAEQMAIQYRDALDQQRIQGKSTDRCQGRLRRMEERLAMLRQSLDHVLADDPVPPRPLIRKIG